MNCNKNFRNIENVQKRVGVYKKSLISPLSIAVD